MASSSKKTKTVQVVRDESGRTMKMILPPRSLLTAREGSEHLRRVAEEEESIAPFTRVFGNAMPWEGAKALETVLMRDYSATFPQNCPQSGRPNTELKVESASGITNVRWGSWSVAAIGTAIVGGSEGGMAFRLTIMAKRLISDKVDILFDKVAEEITKQAFYKNCAVELAVDDEGFIILSPPKVRVLEKMTRDDLILPKHLKTQIEAFLFDPIEFPDMWRKSGANLRRGSLLIGPPGTGKTQTCRIAANLAIKNGWCVFYIGDSRGISQALTLAQNHSPALLICEDIDRQLGKKRDAATDRLLNAIDGLDRSSEVKLICTTNDASQLPEALTRDGRFSGKYIFTLPDAWAAEKLLQLYLGSSAPDDLTSAAAICAGMLPASIREVSERARGFSLHRTKDPKANPTAEDVRLSALSVRSANMEMAKLHKADDGIPTLKLRHEGQTDDPRKVATYLMELVAEHGLPDGLLGSPEHHLVSAPEDAVHPDESLDS